MRTLNRNVNYVPPPNYLQHLKLMRATSKHLKIQDRSAKHIFILQMHRNIVSLFKRFGRYSFKSNRSSARKRYAQFYEDINF